MEFGYEAMKAHVRQQEIDSIDRQAVALPACPEGGKFLHWGYPLGALLLPEAVSEPPADAVPLSVESRWLGEDTCIVAYLREVFRLLIQRSCGKCVLCREGLWQLALLFDAISRGSASMERLSFAKELAAAMAQSSDCDFGRGAGRMAARALVDFEEEITAHIRRKRCPALACPAFYTVHILPDRCTGCGDCLDECPEEAITGKAKFIHMIDNDTCERCGKCMEVCQEDAIVKAGPVKPRTPTRLTRVGAFKGSRRKADEDDED